MKLYIRILICLLPFAAISQDIVEGIITEANQNNKKIGLAGANVYWLNSQIGTITNNEGFFSIPFSKNHNKLIISYVGFKSDTIKINGPKKINHTLQPSSELDEVVVQKKRDAVQKAYLTPQNVITVNSAELLKAACCNLSESFETNPAIDVNFSDALTGTKQIQMLGLTSPYLLITQENIPMVRGASQAFGLTFTPGTWVESIQITKGAGSVVNGYESISGQINAELVKPFTDHQFFVNGYYNKNGRLEINTHLNHKIDDRWSTGLYVHGNARTQKEDNNEDGFLDAPLANQINIMSRWQYQNVQAGWVSFLNIRFLNDEKQVGQVNFDPDAINAIRGFNPANGFTGGEIWGSEIATKRFDTSVKLGYVFPELPYQSFGFQASYSHHDQESYFGVKRYNIMHKSIYSNLIFNSILGNTKNKFKTGLTFAFDGYQELVNTFDYSRDDASVGGFFEYSFDDLEKVSLTAGLRIDTHNRLGTFITPRLHIRYSPWEKASLRASFGRGKRAANIFAENQQLFASVRQIQISNADGEVYGLNPEDAWNFGASFLQGFRFLDRPGNVTIDFYKTDFKNQIVVDWENPRLIKFYNLEGTSTASSVQFEVNHEILPNLELRTAYKFYDVNTDYQSENLQKPLQAQHRFFLNMGFETVPKENGSLWRFDYTLHTVGEQRLPNTEVNPPQYRLPGYSKGYSLMNAQVTKVFSKKFEFYVGGENLSNFKQSNPVLGAENPFGANFDTSIIYAPIMGRMFYAGFRYKQ